MFPQYYIFSSITLHCRSLPLIVFKNGRFLCCFFLKTIWSFLKKTMRLQRYFLKAIVFEIWVFQRLYGLLNQLFVSALNYTITLFLLGVSLRPPPDVFEDNLKNIGLRLLNFFKTFHSNTSVTLSVIQILHQ